LRNGLCNEGLVLVCSCQLHQHNLIGDLRRRYRQALFKMQHIFRSPRKRCTEQALQQAEVILAHRRGIMNESKHSLGHLLSSTVFAA